MTAAPSLRENAEASSDAEVVQWLQAVRRGFGAGSLSPYLGPGVLADSGDIPTSYGALADFIGARVTLPRRARGQVWAAAQYVESSRHRKTLEQLMTDAFAKGGNPQPLHRYLAGLSLPLIVDTWYDGATRNALRGQANWVEIQGISRAGVGEGRWFQAYDPQGAELPAEAAESAGTVLYAPHGGAAPAGNFLISDADYVEVLTEIDIQTPIPAAVKQRRSSSGWVFLGTRFHDQTLRIFARQITKRSVGPVFAALDPDVGWTRNESKFLVELGAHTIVAPLPHLVEALISGE